MKRTVSELKHFHWRLWLSLCALALIPAIYQTIKTFLISTGGQDGAFDVIGQMEWFDLINETLQAFLIVPLYSILNRIYKNCRSDFAGATFKTGLCAFWLYTLFSIGVLIYGSVLIGAMNPGEIDIAVTSVYLRLETVSFMTGIIVSFANVVFVVIGRDKNVYIFLAVRTALSLIADFLLIPRFGVYGVAVSNILANTLLSAACLLLLYRQGCLRFCRFRRSDGVMFREWCKTGVFSGLQQFIDNFIYAVAEIQLLLYCRRKRGALGSHRSCLDTVLPPCTGAGKRRRNFCYRYPARPVLYCLCRMYHYRQYLCWTWQNRLQCGQFTDH